MDLSKYKLSPTPTPGLNAAPGGVNLSKYKIATTATPAQSGGFGGALGTVAGEALKGAANVGIGALKGVGSTAVGLWNLGQKAGGAIGKVTGIPTADLSVHPKILEAEGMAQQIGKGAEQIAEFFLPAGIIGKAQKALDAGIAGTRIAKAAATGGKVAKAAKGAIGLAGRSALGAAEAAGVTAAQTGGDREAVENAAGLGAAIPAVGSTLGAAYKYGKGKLVGGVGDNVARALGFTGKRGITQTTQAIERNTQSLKQLADSSRGMTVKDINGVEKVFEPSKATFWESLQALQASMKKAYQKYTQQAVAAGEKDVMLGKEDFWKIHKALSAFTKDSTSTFYNRARTLTEDMMRNFGGVDAVGKFVWKPTSPERMQSFLEKVNLDFSPTDPKALSEVSGELSRAIRNILDDKIMKSTGQSYQAARNEYMNLVAIEKALINQTKRATTGVGGQIGRYIQGIGVVDALSGLFQHGVSTRGAALFGLGKLMNHLKDPEAALRRVFQSFEAPKARGAVPAYIFGQRAGAKVPLTTGERKAAGMVTRAIDEPKLGFGTGTKHAQRGSVQTGAATAVAGGLAAAGTMAALPHKESVQNGSGPAGRIVNLNKKPTFGDAELDKMSGVESSNDPTATSQESQGGKARGAFQIQQGTWQELFDIYPELPRVPYEKGWSDPVVSRKYASVYLNKRIPEILESKGIKPTREAILAFYGGYGDDVLKMKGDFSKFSPDSKNYIKKHQL